MGTSADTSEFAVDAIRWWWQHPNRPRFKREDRVFNIITLNQARNDATSQLW